MNLRITIINIFKEIKHKISNFSREYELLNGNSRTDKHNN